MHYIAKIAAFLLIGVLGIAASATAQFLNLEIEITPEVSLNQVQKLDFGTFYRNAGVIKIELGDMNMGVLNVTGSRSQLLQVDLAAPSYLVHRNPAIKDRIPFQMNAAYANKGANDYREATVFKDNTALFKILDGNVSSKNSENDVWENAYIYLYGSLNVGNIEPGVYEGTVLLRIGYY